MLRQRTLLQRSALHRLGIVLVTALAYAVPAVPIHAQSFYPPPPDPPRVQLLKKLHSEADIRRKPNWFLRFLFGRQLRDQWLRKALVRPYSLAFRDGDLLVSDSRSGSYWRFDMRRQTLHLAADAPGRAGIQSSLGLAVDGRGRILVTDSVRQELLVFESEGKLAARYGQGLLERPAGIAVDGDSVFVVDAGAYRLVAFDIAGGAYRIVIGAENRDDSPLGGPTAVAVAPDGSLYISETLAGRVTRYARDGTLLSTVGTLGTGFGQFGAPKGVAVDREGRLYVADARFERIQIFDDEGRLLLVFGQLGDPENDVELPAGIAIDYEGVPFWQQFAAEGFELEYVVAVVRQYEPAAVYVYGFGRMAGVDYEAPPPPT